MLHQADGHPALRSSASPLSLLYTRTTTTRPPTASNGQEASGMRATDINGASDLREGGQQKNRRGGAPMKPSITQYTTYWLSEVSGVSSAAGSASTVPLTGVLGASCGVITSSGTGSSGRGGVGCTLSSYVPPIRGCPTSHDRPGPSVTDSRSSCLAERSFVRPVTVSDFSSFEPPLHDVLQDASAMPVRGRNLARGPPVCLPTGATRERA